MLIPKYEILRNKLNNFIKKPNIIGIEPIDKNIHVIIIAIIKLLKNDKKIKFIRK